MEYSTNDFDYPRKKSNDDMIINIKKLNIHSLDGRVKKIVIPNTVTDLEFMSDFNSPLDEGIIPNSVRCLAFSHNFNQPLKEGIIPNSVEYVDFGHNFD